MNQPRPAEEIRKGENGTIESAKTSRGIARAHLERGVAVLDPNHLPRHFATDSVEAAETSRLSVREAGAPAA